MANVRNIYELSMARISRAINTELYVQVNKDRRADEKRENMPVICIGRCVRICGYEKRGLEATK